MTFRFVRMEWMLQVWDELDDVVSTARLCWVGARRSAALLFAGLLGAASLYSVQTFGKTTVVFSVLLILTCAVPALTLSRLRLTANRNAWRPLR